MRVWLLPSSMLLQRSASMISRSKAGKNTNKDSPSQNTRGCRDDSPASSFFIPDPKLYRLPHIPRVISMPAMAFFPPIHNLTTSYPSPDSLTFLPPSQKDQCFLAHDRCTVQDGECHHADLKPSLNLPRNLHSRQFLRRVCFHSPDNAKKGGVVPLVTPLPSSYPNYLFRRYLFSYSS